MRAICWSRSFLGRSTSERENRGGVEFLAMKNLRNANDKEEIARRVDSVQPDSARLWGKMSAHQMICHLSDGFRLYMGEKKVAPAGGMYPSKALRWIALWAPMQWPHGFKTMPELDQQAGGGTSPVEFARDVRELRNLLERFVRQPQDFRWPAHPHFGEMSERDWMRLAYLHADHHLRQFGA
jgi:hypothetical protein